MNFIYLIFSLLTIGFMLYGLYTVIQHQRASKKYEEAKDQYTKTMTEIYTKLLGQNNDGAVYYDWGIDILKQYEEHNMFSLEEAADKFRLAFNLLEGEDKVDASEMLRYCLLCIFLDGNETDTSLNAELDQHLKLNATNKTNDISYLFDWALFKYQRKDNNQSSIDDLNFAIDLFTKIEKIYDEPSTENQSSVSKQELYTSWINALFKLASETKNEIYLPQILDILEKIKVISVPHDYYLDLKYVRYYLTRYQVTSNEENLQNMDKFCKDIVDRRGSNTNKSEVYSYWATCYSLIALEQENESFLNKAIELFKEAIQLNENNIEAITGLADSYSTLGNFTKQENYFKQGLELVLSTAESMFYDPRETTTEEIQQLLSDKLSLFKSAVTIMKDNISINSKTQNREYIIRLGDNFILFDPNNQYGYQTKAEGLLYISVLNNQFDKKKKEIFKLLQKTLQIASKKEKQNLDRLDYLFAAYHAQTPIEDEQMYQYLNKYLGAFTPENRNQEGQAIKEDYLFANYKNSSKFNSIVNG